MARPDVVVVGAAARDVVDDDPRGWRLGGGVTYGGLALARLGVRTGVLVGLDQEARGAPELDLLRDAGAEVVEVPLEHGPVFINEELPTGRVQTCLSVSDPVPTEALPEPWRSAPAWLIAPVAAEVGEEWAEFLEGDPCVALGWQGMLRHLFPGERVWPLDPRPSALLRCADIVGVSRHDLPHGLAMEDVVGWLGSRAEVLLTAGPLGGALLGIEQGRVRGGRRYRAIPAGEEVDPTGAGDTMLSGVLAARIAGGPAARRSGADLRIGAAAASLLVEATGLGGVPWLGAVRERVRTMEGS
jgi:sugar/nucleoside kinase (ribokinase family)